MGYFGNLLEQTDPTKAGQQWSEHEMGQIRRVAEATALKEKQKAEKDIAKAQKKLNLANIAMSAGTGFMTGGPIGAVAGAMTAPTGKTKLLPSVTKGAVGGMGLKQIPGVAEAGGDLGGILQAATKPGAIPKTAGYLKALNEPATKNLETLMGMGKEEPDWKEKALFTHGLKMSEAKQKAVQENIMRAREKALAFWEDRVKKDSTLAEDQEARARNIEDYIHTYIRQEYPEQAEAIIENMRRGGLLWRKQVPTGTVTRKLERTGRHVTAADIIKGGKDPARLQNVANR